MQQRTRLSIASSASNCKVAGIVSPNALAVLRLIANWNLTGCWIGRSPGFTLLRTLAAYSMASSRCMSARL